MRPGAMAFVALALLLLAGAPAAHAQVPAIPPYETVLTVTVPEAEMTLPGVPITKNVSFVLTVRGPVPSGEVTVRPDGKLAPSGWSVRLEPASVKLDVSGMSAEEERNVRGWFTLTATPRLDTPAVEPRDMDVRLKAEATQWTREAVGLAPLRLQVAPVGAFRVASAPANVSVPADSPATVSLAVRNTGNVPLRVFAEADRNAEAWCPQGAFKDVRLGVGNGTADQPSEGAVTFQVACSAAPPAGMSHLQVVLRAEPVSPAIAYAVEPQRVRVNLTVAAPPVPSLPPPAPSPAEPEEPPLEDGLDPEGASEGEPEVAPEAPRESPAAGLLAVAAAVLVGRFAARSRGRP